MEIGEQPKAQTFERGLQRPDSQIRADDAELVALVSVAVRGYTAQPTNAHGCQSSQRLSTRQHSHSYYRSCEIARWSSAGWRSSSLPPCRGQAFGPTRTGIGWSGYRSGLGVSDRWTWWPMWPCTLRWDGGARVD